MKEQANISLSPTMQQALRLIKYRGFSLRARKHIGGDEYAFRWSLDIHPSTIKALADRELIVFTDWHHCKDGSRFPIKAELA